MSARLVLMGAGLSLCLVSCGDGAHREVASTSGQAARHAEDACKLWAGVAKDAGRDLKTSRHRRATGRPQQTPAASRLDPRWDGFAKAAQQLLEATELFDRRANSTAEPTSAETEIFRRGSVAGVVLGRECARLRAHTKPAR